MRRGFTLIELMIFVAIFGVLLAIAIQLFQEAWKPDEMRKSGCGVIGYAGERAQIKVYRCPGYDDVVTERDWNGPREVEKM